jgi:signal peptidase II
VSIVVAPRALAGSGVRFEWWLVPIIIVLDQVTKAMVRAYVPLHDVIPVVTGLVNLTHVENSGAAFGLLNEADFPYKRLVVALFAAVALGGITAFAARLDRHEVMARVGLALILGGAAGNLIDRITAGAVVDFVDVVFGSWHFWAFNVADAAITLGVGAMFFDMFGIGRHVPTTS